MKLKFLLLFLIFLLIPFVLSAPPVTTVQQFPEGYIISEQQYHVFKLGEPLRYGFLLENATNGLVVNDSAINYCRLVVSNNQGFNTQSIDIFYNDTYRLWGIELNETQVLEIFPEVGFYNYLVSCQDDFGGVISGVFEVNTSGYGEESNNLSYLIFSLILLLGIFLYLASQYMNSDKTFGVGLYFYLISFILLVYVLFLQFNLMDKMLYWLGLSNIQSIIYSSITYSLIGIALIGFTYLLVKYLGLIKERKSSINYGNNYNSKSKSYEY